LIPSAEVASRNFQSATRSVRRELKIDRTTEFTVDKLADESRPIARLARRVDDGFVGFQPFDAQPIACFTIR
jgi:hypothetical protein